jgi:uncharacterized peroxidase-related enzyme
MARITLQKCELQDEATQNIYDEVEKYVGYVPAAYRAFSLQKNILEANWGRTLRIMQEGELPLELKESIGFAVSKANECELGILIHRDKLKKHDLSEEEISKRENADSSDEKIKAVLQFCVKFSVETKNISDADFDAIRELGYSDANIMEMLTVAEMYTGYNKIINALDLKITDRIRCA